MLPAQICVVIDGLYGFCACRLYACICRALINVYLLTDLLCIEVHVIHTYR